MKTTFLMIFIGILTLLPVIIAGSRNSDGAIKDSFEKGLAYNRTQSIVESSDIRWKSIDCVNNVCKITLSVLPEPDSDSITIKIFRPANNIQLLTGLSTGDGVHWVAEFKAAAPGWYAGRVEYTYKGDFVDDESTFFVDNI